MDLAQQALLVPGLFDRAARFGPIPATRRRRADSSLSHAKRVGGKRVDNLVA